MDKLPTSYRQVTDTLPTVGRLSADCRPTVGRQVAYISGKTCRPTVGRQVFWGALLHNYRQIINSIPKAFPCFWLMSYYIIDNSLSTFLQIKLSVRCVRIIDLTLNSQKLDTTCKEKHSYIQSTKI